VLGGTSDRTASEVRSQPANGDPVASPESRRRAATSLIESHDRVFRRTARRYSICADDAEDAYQRALEILLTKAPPIEGDALVRWMQTVTKREALAVRRQRERLLSPARPPGTEEADDRDPLDSIAADGPGPTDRAARRERVARSGEALRSLKPQEVRALTLKAQGYSYAEIGEITGWTYTKINRCMAEGRKRFLQVFADIEQGKRCEELATALSELADGENANGATEAVTVHLRTCSACRAKLRAFRSIPQRVLELFPGPAMDQSTGGHAHTWVAERAGAAIDRVREVGYSLLARGSGGDGAVVASAGGTRGAGMAAVAKVLAVCGATAAGSATCVATGIVDPGAIAGGKAGTEKPGAERPITAPSTSQSAQQVSARPDHAAEASKVQASDEPLVTPTQQKQRQFSFEAAASSSPASGGGEFGGPTSGSSGGSGGGGSGGEFPPPIPR
jgi:RNA polymerase sigma factor (sigma-70 family)